MKKIITIACIIVLIFVVLSVLLYIFTGSEPVRIDSSQNPSVEQEKPSEPKQ